ncbi:type II toxin-antitoxin system RelB/DinJ family antitoxin, partial [uncultured Helicobacter sp.]
MTSLVQFRMDSNDKELLETMLKDMGLDLGTAFRIFAAKVLKTGEIPFQ